MEWVDIPSTAYAYALYEDNHIASPEGRILVRTTLLCDYTA